ncbi:cyclopropane-fatty-acyl-phospholipid synthase family protein [uncultured Shewanella sp.]|uniref:SAM-dependent methyltransferase n=1 Tax=uncultured Shewanella sp. TaxID=173975 RepID=UPI0026371753|nr:class I SAM-dependent methyltransferase [uncultured Shewanella sp.]
MWDERYDREDYVYGTKPNTFLKENRLVLPKGEVLSLAEGEGRNAVFLAQQGYRVTAVDGSMVGIDKARRLADKAGVTVDFIHGDLAHVDIGQNCWDAVVSIFCPLPSMIRQRLYLKVEKGLKKGGVFMLEAYRPEQLAYGTGGGSDSDVMQNVSTLRAELPRLAFSHLCELEREVIEGVFHTGKGAVVQAIATKV